MMINLAEYVKKYRKIGYDEMYATAKVSQDIILRAIEKSKYKNNITVKGGIVMFNLTKNIRRATIDIDIDLIHLSLGNPNIIKIFDDFGDEDVKFTIDEEDIEELRHEDYKGKRVNVKIIDNFNNEILTKIDIGVHTKFDILLDEICFEISTTKSRSTLLVNSREQIFVEKIVPLLKHGSATTRYKDLFDIYWLIKNCKLDKDKIMFIFEKKVFSNGLNSIYSYEALLHSLRRVLISKILIASLDKTNNNWLNVNASDLTMTILEFLEKLVPINV